MLHLLRKEWAVTRWAQILSLALGLLLVPLGLAEPDALPFVILFYQIAYSHILFNMYRQTKVSRPDNLLLLSLPTTRGRIMNAKYLFVLICAVLYPAYLCGIVTLLGLFGLGLSTSPWVIWPASALIGVAYHLILMPLSFLDARYGTFASMVVYCALILLPSRIGSGVSGAQLASFLARVRDSMGGWVAPALLAAGLLALGALSFFISRRLYLRAEF